MEPYQIERLQVEQETMWKGIRGHIEGDAQSQAIHQVELNPFKCLLRLGLMLLKEVLARRGTGKSGADVTLDDGTILPYHSLKERRYLSIFGWVKIVRASYWREGQRSWHPLDVMLALPESCYSYLLTQWVDLNIIDEAYDKALEKITRVFDLPLWKRGQEDLVLKTAANVGAFYDAKAAPTVAGEGAVLCVTADCKGVRMVPSEKPQLPSSEPEAPPARRSKGEKRAGLRRDAVVTANFTFVPAKRTPEELVELLMRETSVEERRQRREALRLPEEKDELPPRTAPNKEVRACMFGEEQAFRDLMERILKCDPTEKKPICALIDGAKSLERELKDALCKRGWEPRITGVCLDIIHVMEHLWDAGTALYGEKSAKRPVWVRSEALALLKGKVGRVTGGLRQTLRKRGKMLRVAQKRAPSHVIAYFSNHQHMMKYDEYPAAGYPIATGVIEGACGSLVKDRTDQSGMRWTRMGAQAVLDLRAVHRNDDWNAFWEFHIKREQSRLYGRNAA